MAPPGLSEIDVSIVLLRTLIVGFAIWIAAFNRWCMTESDDSLKLRRGFLLLIPCFVLPLPFAIWAPGWFDGISWVAFCLVVLLEIWRLSRQAIGFTTARSKVVPVAGLRGSTRSTHALQVRSWQYPGAPHSMDGLTVAFLSDFHCGGRPSCEWYDKMWDVVRAIGPDLVVLGGDYVDRLEDIPIFERCLHGLQRLPLRLGTYAVLGNHDQCAPGAVRETLRQAGAVLVEDRWFTIRREDGRKFILHGTSAPFHGCGDPVKGIPPGGAHISVTHTPDNAPSLAKAGSRYILAGHTHGGQLCLPFLGAVVVPSRFSRRWAYGGHQVGHSNLVVTSGLGTAGVPLRFLCPPEIAVIRFHA